MKPKEKHLPAGKCFLFTLGRFRQRLEVEEGEAGEVNEDDGQFLLRHLRITEEEEGV